jgi:hypothetical protein
MVTNRSWVCLEMGHPNSYALFIGFILSHHSPCYFWGIPGPNPLCSPILVFFPPAPLSLCADCATDSKGIGAQ